MKKNSVQAQVEWTPREFNSEADALFELRVEPHTLKWHVLDRALEMGLIGEKAHERFRRSGGLPDLVDELFCGRNWEKVHSQRLIDTRFIDLHFSVFLFFVPFPHSLVFSFCLSHVPPNMGYLYVCLSHFIDVFPLFCSFRGFPRFPGSAGFTEFKYSSLWSWSSTPLHGVHLLWTAARNADVSHGATGS